MQRASGNRGPDKRLRESICQQLFQRGEDVDASEVTVAVKGSVVTLHGAVPEERMKHAIEEIVADCPGVQTIDNYIRVTYGEHHLVHAERAVDGGAGAVASIGTTTGSAGG